MTIQHRLDIPSEAPVPDDPARAAYRERLRQHLRDPEFRAIEGFPIGKDEDILALSDPPYYTACPNPFLGEIVEGWQAERAALRQSLGLPEDSGDNGNGGPASSPLPLGEGQGVRSYHREPFASDVSEGKNDPIYNAHSYHTKVPHKAIMRYILHYTDPGDIVLDGFCGTGMTGVAAQLCGDRKAVQALGYRVDEAGVVRDGDRTISRLGARKAVLVDLSPAATFIAYNYNTPVDVPAFEQEARRILDEVERECGWMYETWHPRCDAIGRLKARINYTVWSDVFICPHCGHEVVFWHEALDKESGQVRDQFPCPGCTAALAKTPRKGTSAARLERAWETVVDRALGLPVRRAKQAPVLINYSVGRQRHEKAPDAEDLALIQRIEESDIPYPFPTDRMPDGFNTRQPKESHGITHVHQFYTRRNLWVLAAVWRRAEESSLSPFVLFCATSFLVKTGSRLHNIGFKEGSLNLAGAVPNVLYVPSGAAERHVLSLLKRKMADLTHVLRLSTRRGSVLLETRSASAERRPVACADYVFVDPPFGGNLMYSELNFVWEAWLRVFTNNAPEAVVNAVQRKRLVDYQRLMERCFAEFHRVLKPGRWMTVEFHNSQNAVWNAIQEAILRAGFMVADVRTLDKQAGTFKQVTSTGAVKQDLIISAYKPQTGFEKRFQTEAGTPQGAWGFARQHLRQLPIVVRQDGLLEVVVERLAYLLFDRMVAFHIQRGATVPLSAAELYAGLKQRFVERDGMFFLPDQVPEYDRARLDAPGLAQLTLMVSDEKGAIHWLRAQLDPAQGGAPQTYQELQPQFLKQLHQSRHEALPELSVVLAEGFLQDEQGRWQAPDPHKASDLEKVRQKALLREFDVYAKERGRLRQFRTEAVRAGFADAWRRSDYAVIVRVAERLPESVLQEDADLLMYYDNASLRVK